MSLVENDPVYRIEWTDPVTGKKGYLVIHNLGASGLCTGGTRMRAGCTMAEVEDLARRMALKAGALGLPIGGAKGGIDCDPQDPVARGVLTRFMSAMRLWLENHWVTAEDLGMSQQLLDEIFVELELGQSYYAAISRSTNPEATLQRVRAGLSAPVDGGYTLGNVVGGYGVAQSCLAAARAKGWRVEDTTVAVQGVGTMGGAAAYYLHEAGMRVIHVADAKNSYWIKNERLDIPALLATRNQYREIDPSMVGEGVLTGDRDDPLYVEVDILIPAATSSVIREDNVDGVQAEVIVEAANLAVTEDAERRLAARYICVVPDFVANAGAVGWAWWLLLGYVDDNPQTTFDKLHDVFSSNVESMVRAWEESRITPRVSAIDLAEKAISQSAVQTVTIP